MRRKSQVISGWMAILSFVFLGVQCSEKEEFQAVENSFVENPIPLPSLRADFEMIAGAGTGAGAGAGNGAEAGAGIGVGAGAGNGAEAGAGIGVGAETGNGAEAGAGIGVEAGAGNGAEAEVGAGAGADAGSEAEAGIEAGAGTGAETGFCIGTGTGTRSVTTADGKVSWSAEDRLKAFIVPADVVGEWKWDQYRHEYLTNEKDCVNGVFRPAHPRSLDARKKYDWYVMSPYSDQVKDPVGGAFSQTEFSFDGQTIDLSHPLAHLTAYDVVTGVAKDIPADQTPALQLKHKGTLMKFTLRNTDSQDMVLEKVDFIAPEGVNIGGTYSVDFTPEGVLTPITAANQLTVTIGGTDKVLKAGASAELYVVMPPFTLDANKSFTLKVHTSVGVIERTTTPKKAKSFLAGTLNTASIGLNVIRLDYTSLSLKEQNTIQLHVLNSKGEVSWTSSNPAIAEVNASGVVTGVCSGRAEITATVESSAATFKCDVRVVGENDTVIMVGEVPMVMVKVQADTLKMGAQSTDPNETNYDTDAYGDEKPVHQVILTQDYYIGQYEVTQELWVAVMGSNPSYFSGHSQYPVEQVSWKDICGPEGFLKKLNALTGKSFSLPTEAQWEYAARGGNQSKDYKYSGSDDIAKVAWYRGNSGSETHPVGEKLPNELGIYDMSGNVSEWCADWYDSKYYEGAPLRDPTGPTSGDSRVIRGGYWDDARYCRLSGRNVGNPGSPSSFIGFRLVLVP